MHAGDIDIFIFIYLLGHGKRSRKRCFEGQESNPRGWFK
jgi:hypothetical protein